MPVRTSPRHVVTIPAKRMLDRVAHRLLTPARLKRLARLPALPAAFRRRYAAAPGPWQSFTRDIPMALRTSPGIVRDATEEDRAYAEQPLYSFHHNYPNSVMWALARLWQSVIPVGPRLMRAIARVQTTGGDPGGARTHTASPQVLTDGVRADAAAVGLSTIGIAAYDERYTFADSDPNDIVGDTIIVCILEQNWPTTQMLPGPVPEQTALSTNAELMEMVAALADRLRGRGHRARAHTSEGVAIVHHYAVEAGLGQLGYNGQLLTPQAGSRCRLALISTNASLVRDEPRDFGVPAICNQCQACVQRCPSGAIPSRPKMYRGVEKAKLNLERCFPVVAQANGCSVCMKVCPVQRYGLEDILDHYEQTGEILGRGTDDLEGYDWPLDGMHYGPDERPRLPKEFFDVPGFGRYAESDQQRAMTENPLM